MFPGPLNPTTGWVVIIAIVLAGFVKAITDARK